MLTDIPHQSLVVARAESVEQPTCKSDPCITVDGKVMILVGWLVTGEQDALDRVKNALTSSYWSITAPWKTGDRLTLRIYTQGKSPDAAAGIEKRLKSLEFGRLEVKSMMIPAPGAN
ncbi:hypothetical protein IAG41_04210 [Sphingomonas sp. JC676]|uniref:hypothetical protein n=1 Tax=Sphingomonas sp. JC676 TaxID=2768065 RepID=UPI001657EFB1|nr:hypothetical protein [Sphingomonas sp. JC676]MBC9031589.1 hypothetical protein [Sphingomonas sp. JC676]